MSLLQELVAGFKEVCRLSGDDMANIQEQGDKWWFSQVLQQRNEDIYKQDDYHKLQIFIAKKIKDFAQPQLGEAVLDFLKKADIPDEHPEKKEVIEPCLPEKNYLRASNKQAMELDHKVI